MHNYGDYCARGAFGENRIVTEKRGRIAIAEERKITFSYGPRIVPTYIRRQKRTVQIARSPLIWLCL